MNRVLKLLLYHLKRAWESLVYVDTFDVLACPGCGNLYEAGPGKTDFSTTFSVVVCKCPRCGAQYGRDTVVPHAKWKLKGIDELNAENETKQGDVFREMMQRERTELGIKR